MTTEKENELAQRRKRLAAASKEAYVNVYFARRHSNESGDSELITPLGPFAHVNLKQRFPSGELTDGVFSMSDEFEAIASVMLAVYPPPVYRVLLENAPPAEKILGGKGKRRAEGFEQDLVDKAKQHLANKIDALDRVTSPEWRGGTGPFTHLFKSASGAVAKRFAREIQHNKTNN